MTGLSSNNWQYILKLSIVFGVLMLVSGSVQAQKPQQETRDDSDFILEEIIVTASKRQQTIHEIPIAVSVTDADTIEKACVLDISDLQTLVPSLRVPTFQTTANTNFLSGALAMVPTTLVLSHQLAYLLTAFTVRVLQHQLETCRALSGLRCFVVLKAPCLARMPPRV